MFVTVVVDVLIALLQKRSVARKKKKRNGTNNGHRLIAFGDQILETVLLFFIKRAAIIAGTFGSFGSSIRRVTMCMISWSLIK